MNLGIKSDPVRVCVSGVRWGMFAFLLFSFVLTHYAGYGYPFTSFLSASFDRSMDFFNVNYMAHGLDPYTLGSSYPPFAMIVAKLFSLGTNYDLGSIVVRDSPGGTLAMALFITPFFVFLVAVIHRHVRGEGRIRDLSNSLTLALSYPVLFTLDRANYLMLVFVLLYFFWQLHRSESSAKRWVGLACLACAIAMKIYPVLFVLLLVSERRWKDSVLVSLGTAVLTLASFALLKGELFANAHKFLANVSQFVGGYANDLQNLSWSSSGMGLLKIPLMLAHRAMPSALDRVYSVLCLGALCFLILYVLTEERSRRKLLLITACLILLPKVAPDYNLTYLYLPLFAYLSEKEDLERVDLASLLAITLLLVPKSYFILFHDNRIWNISVQSFINPLLLSALILGHLLLLFSRSTITARRDGGSR